MRPCSSLRKDLRRVADLLTSAISAEHAGQRFSDSAQGLAQVLFKHGLDSLLGGIGQRLERASA